MQSPLKAALPLVVERELGGVSAAGANAILSLKVPAALASAFPLHANETVVSSGWEPVGVPVGTAFAVGLVWIVCNNFVRRTAKPRWGSELDDFGMPIWRCATGMWTQCLVLPSLFLLSLMQWGFCMEAWHQAAGEHLFTPDGQRYYDWAFVYIFAGYMLEDFVLHRCSAIMIAHHAGCLVGLAFGFAGLPAGKLRRRRSSGCLMHPTCPPLACPPALSCLLSPALCARRPPSDTIPGPASTPRQRSRGFSRASSRLSLAAPPSMCIASTRSDTVRCSPSYAA